MCVYLEGVCNITSVVCLSFSSCQKLVLGTLKNRPKFSHTAHTHGEVSLRWSNLNLPLNPYSVLLRNIDPSKNTANHFGA